jgi:tetrathionate reductase subunit C
VDNIIEIINLTKLFEWGPAVPQYFFFTGISAAAFLVSSLVIVFGDRRFRPIAGLALILAFTMLLAAPLNLVADLAQPGRFYELFYRLHLTSPMSWGVFLLIAYGLLMLAESLFVFRSGFARRAQFAARPVPASFYRFLALGDPQVTASTEARDQRLARLLGAAAIPFAIGIEIYTGFLLFFALGRPLWSSPLLPAIFLVSGLVSGLALLVLLGWWLVRQHGRPFWTVLNGLGVMLGWTILVDLALRVAWHGLAYITNPVAYLPVLQFLFQEHFVESVVLEAGLGLLLPAAVMLVGPLRRLRPLFLTAAFLAFVGVWLFRWTTVIGGQEIPKILAGYYAYQPALMGGKGVMEIVANWSLWVFLFILFTWFTPWRPAELERSAPPAETVPAVQAGKLTGGAS